MANFMENIWQEYFVRPAMDTSLQGYNIVNTAVYGIILLVVAFFIVFPFLDKRKVKFDFKFMLSLLPYIVFGSTARVIEDLGIFQRSMNPLEFGYYTYTPGIYIAVGLLAIASLFVSRFLSAKMKIDFYKLFAGIWILFALPVVCFNLLYFKVWAGFFGILALAAVLTYFIIFVYQKLGKKLFEDNMNKVALFGQALDGGATYVALNFFSCGEQHVVSRAIIENLGPAAFPLIKIALVVLILGYLEKEIKDKNLKGFIKIFITIIGLAPGIRDLFTVAVGTCL